jgi:hypothetical protein
MIKFDIQIPFKTHQGLSRKKLNRHVIYKTLILRGTFPNLTAKI